MTKKLGNRRVSGTEQYYTPKALASQLVGLTLKTIPNAAEKSFLEPAGGTGSFIDALRQSGITSITSVDKSPKHPSVSQADFLEWMASTTGLIISPIPLSEETTRFRCLFLITLPSSQTTSLF